MSFHEIGDPVIVTEGGLPQSIHGKPSEIVMLVTDNSVNKDGVDITNALKTLLATGNKRVYFPDGLYKITSEISLQDNTIIECSANAIFYDPNYRVAPHRFFSAKNKTNVQIINAKIYGDNAVFARDSDGFAEIADGFSTGTAIYFENITNGFIKNIKTKYMVESIILKLCKDSIVTGCKTEQSSEGYTQSGIQLAACVNSHISQCRVINGGDGTLYMYNGSHCSIKDCLVENSNPAVFHDGGCGMETCDHCVINNVKVVGAFAGFSVVESARNSVVKNCIAQACHVGYLISPYGNGGGIAGVDISFENCSSIKHQKLLNISYPVSGFYITYGTVNTGHMTKQIKITNCYFGKTNVGKAIVAVLPTTVTVDELIITNNVFESWTYAHEESLEYNSKESLIEIDGVKGAIITNNHFVFQSTSNFPSSQIDFKNCINVLFSNNIIFAKSANHQICIDNTCNDFSIVSNIFRSSYTGGYRVILIGGNNHVINSNQFKGSGDMLMMGRVSGLMIMGNNAPGISTDYNFIDTTANMTNSIVRNNNGTTFNI